MDCASVLQSHYRGDTLHHVGYAESHAGLRNENRYILISVNQQKSFSDYSLVKGKFDFYIASPSKALFDLLYFRTHQFRSVRLEDVGKIVEEFRIDIDEMDEAERNKFYEKVKAYLHG